MLPDSSCRVTTRGRSLISALLAGAALLLIPATAQAQVQAVGSPAPAPVTTTAPSGPPAAVDSGGVQDIIVSARRRNEGVQQTPIAVTAVAPAQLEAMASLKISDLQGQAPNVLITNQSTGAAAANISIRGISFADVEKSFDPAVGVMIDGVYIGTSTGQLLDFFDIASIEVLRGPQGTLFGRNTIGGVINIRRSKPTGDWGAKVQADYSSFNSFAGRGIFNAPIVKGLLAAKAFYFHQQTDGFYRSGLTGDRLGRDNSNNFGASFLLTPSSNFDALLTLEKQVDDGAPVVTSISEGVGHDSFCAFVPAQECGRNRTTDPYTTYVEGANKLHYAAPAATLEMNWDTGPIKLTSVTSYRSSRERQFSDLDGFSVPLYEDSRQQSYHQFSQELRGSGKLFRGFDYVAGLYYFASAYHLHEDNYIVPDAFPNLTNSQDTHGTSKSYAAFVDFNWNILDKVRLSGGGRFTYDKKSNEQVLTTGANVVYLDVPTVRHHWNKFTPKLVLDYRPNRDLMVYASWSRGYRSGGFNGRGQTLFSASLPYNPETVDAYEIGIKSEWLNHKLVLNLAGFYSDYKDIQESTTLPVATPPFQETVISNAASAKIKGIEADLTARPTSRLTFRSSVGLLDSHFKNFLDDGGAKNYSNIDLIYAPKLTMSVGADYVVPTSFGELRANSTFRHLSHYDQQIAPADPSLVNGVEVYARNDPAVRTNTQNLLDLSFSVVRDIGKGKATATLFSRNLLDNRGTATAFNVAGLFSFATMREPRVFGIQLGYDF